MDNPLSTSPAKNAISVSELNRQVKTLLEQGLAKLWVEGEISNLARPPSGHLYFSLKDDSSQIRCAYFRQRQRGPTINLENGAQVLAFGREVDLTTRLTTDLKLNIPLQGAEYSA